jgi:hypothetical protein
MGVNATGASCRVGTKGAPLDIAALLLWIVTAGAGFYLLASRPSRPATSPAEEEAVAPATVPAAPPTQAGIPQAAYDALMAGARVPPITHTRITTQPGQHPLLEFMHPALGIVGLGFWLAYVATKFGTFAWVSFGILIVTIAAGLTWYTVTHRRTRAAKGGANAGAAKAGAAKAEKPMKRRLPSRRYLVHGTGAGLTLVLAVITLLVSAHS